MLSSSPSEPAQGVWLWQWGVLRWRWLSTWCGSFSSASQHQNLFAFPKWRYFLLVGKTKIIQNVFLVIRACTGCMALTTMGSTEVVVAEHMVWDSFWCLQIPWSGCCIHQMTIFSWDYEICAKELFFNRRHQSLDTGCIWFCQWRVLTWWWLSTWCGTLCGASQHQNLLFALAKWRYFLGMTKILQNVLWSSSEPAQSIWLCQWGVLRWRWLSTWCGTLPSASTYLNLVASTKWRYFLGTTKLVCELCLYFSVVIRDYTGCIWLSGNDGGTEVVVAEHTMRDSFWCLLTP